MSDVLVGGGSDGATAGARGVIEGWLLKECGAASCGKE